MDRTMDLGIEEAVRRRVVESEEDGSVVLAAVLGTTVPVVARTLRRFEQTGYLRLTAATGDADDVQVLADTRSPRFRDLTRPLDM